MEEQKKFYPRDYSDEELEDLIDKYGDFNVSNPFLGPSHFTKASLGLTELQRRSASRLGKWSLSFSIAAVIISSIAAYFAYSATQISDKWQNQQIQILNEIKCLLDDSRRGRVPC